MAAPQAMLVPRWLKGYLENVDSQASAMCCLTSGHGTSTMKHRVFGEELEPSTACP